MKFFIFALFLSSSVFAFQLTEEEKLADFRQLVATMKAGYGPYLFKQAKLGINTASLEADYEKIIRNSKSNSEFYYLINLYIAKFNDGHFGSSIPTDHIASVDFMVALVDGKALIDTIDRDKLSKEKFPFEKGDEVVSVDGQKTADFITEYSKYRGRGNELSNQVSATYSIVLRTGKFIPVPVSKTVKYEIRRGTSNVIEAVELDWTFKGNPLDEYAGNIDFFRSHKEKVNYDMISSRELFEEDLGDKIDYTYHCSGDTRIAIPSDATIIMKSPFVAYYHQTANGNIGYLRIPHYSPKNEKTGADEYELRFKQYEYAVAELENNTEGLIIDQDHNCGGSVEYLHAILSLFITDEVPPMQFKLLGTKSEYVTWLNWQKELNEYTLAYKKNTIVTNLMKAAWMKGEFLTAKTSISGESVVIPNVVRYTKPIVMLIDHNSGSGGDAFPSLMQGYNRATLMGTRTMGLGGHVEVQPALPNSGITYRMTKSLFYHPNGLEIENYGVTPDIDYKITRNDFLYNYKEYQQAYLSELFKLLK